MTTPSPAPASPAHVRRALQLSVLDGALYAVMAGLGESYLGPLAVELGHQGTALAVLASVPVLCGALAQLFTAQLSAWAGSRRRFVAAGAFFQALSHAGFAWIALTGNTSLLAFLLLRIAFSVSGMVIAPAWGGWMASLVLDEQRQRYFAWRSAVVQLVLMASFTAAGFYLHSEEQRPLRLVAFTVLMLCALVARALSSFTLSLQADPHALRDQAEGSTLGRLRFALVQGRWRVALYVAALTFGAHLAVPFFTPYMLEDLQLDYQAFALLTALSILLKVIAFPICHPLSVRIGLRATLLWGGAGVSLVPYLWGLRPDLTELLVIHVLSGISWAAVEYASFQLLLDSADDHCRIEFLSLAGTLSGVFQVLGSVIGGLLLDQQHVAYEGVFMLSCVCRALPLALLLSLPASYLPRRLPRFLFRFLGVLPVVGPLFRPILRERGDSQYPPPVAPNPAAREAAANKPQKEET